MKRIKSIYGVTLLEVLLVLAIAAMIIVMSIRYYQSASASRQATEALQKIQGIVAAADALAQASGSYTAVNISNDTLKPLLPGGGLSTPWGATITVGGATATTYTINIGSVPVGVCPLLLGNLATYNNFSIGGTPPVNPGTCSTTAATAVTLTYTSNP